MFPRCRTAANTLKMASLSSFAMPIAANAIAANACDMRRRIHACDMRRRMHAYCSKCM